MTIDEAAFERAMAMPGRDGPGMFREFLECYLSALPSAEPGRDRIAVVVNGFGLAVTAAGHRMTDESWRAMESELSNGPFARAIIRCNLPRPSEPVEVEGSVEGVG